jgi:7-carboxy-7-deazaguanine synthase
VRVNEIFESLQGEGPDAGVPATFIRLAGCNLRCAWCDTKYAFDNGIELSVEEVMSQVRSKYVVITGGEPLLQEPALRALVDRLDCNIAIETNGTFSAPDWYKLAIWDVDYKCLSSGEYGKFKEGWLAAIGNTRIKFVVADKQDLVQIENLLSLWLSYPQLIVSPAIITGAQGNKEWAREVWQFCIDKKLRFSLQTHKVLFGAKRGI